MTLLFSIRMLHIVANLLFSVKHPRFWVRTIESSNPQSRIPNPHYTERSPPIGSDLTVLFTTVLLAPDPFAVELPNLGLTSSRPYSTIVPSSERNWRRVHLLGANIRTTPNCPSSREFPRTFARSKYTHSVPAGINAHWHPQSMRIDPASHPYLHYKAARDAEEQV